MAGPQPGKPQPKDIMLIPGSAGLATLQHNKQTFQENRAFAAQWVAKSSTDRGKIEVPIKGALADFTNALKQAAGLARGKEIILLTGHGAIGTQSGLLQTAFDTVPEDDLMATHLHVVTAEVVNLEDVAEKKAGKWVSKPIKQGNVIFRLGQGEIDALAPRRDMLDEIGKAMRDGGVQRLRLLTCNVGNDTIFVSRLSKILGVEIVAYKKFTITLWNDFTDPPPKSTKTSLVQLYVGLEPDFSTTPTTNPPPLVTGKTDPQFTEIPHNDEVTGHP